MLSIRGRKRPKLRLRGNDVPTVDVFITCCGEDVDVVMDTARAACVVDYPEDRFRVVILDDGKDAELQKAIEEMSRDYPNLYYHARIKIKGVPHHFKAGNLTGGTELVTKLPGGEGEYIAALDADMIPEPDWLRAIVAHMVVDDKMALVCPPQVRTYSWIIHTVHLTGLLTCEDSSSITFPIMIRSANRWMHSCMSWSQPKMPTE